VARGRHRRDGSAAEQRATPGSPARLIRDLVALRRALAGPVEELTARDGVLWFRRGRHVVAVNTTGEPRPSPSPARSCCPPRTTKTRVLAPEWQT
jgi:hypothetical protein